MLFSHQTVYPRSKVDSNSVWGLEWEGVGQARLVTDMQCIGLKEGTCFIQCEEGDLAIDCESRHTSFLDSKRSSLTLLARSPAL